jgi:NADPH2:quinone reductase
LRCITIINPGPDNRLEITEQNIPLCNPDEILVKVHAAALNRADLLQRQGKYPHPPGESDILGLELSGEVVTLGKNVQKFKLGERVYGLVAGGALAEYCLVNQYLAALIPDHWDYTYAAALPEALTTAHATIFILGELKTDDHLLIHAAGSGISSLAIQMASHIGATVFSTVSNQKKMDMAHALGASTVINYKTQDFATIIKSNSLDLIVDFIGKTYFTKHLECLKPL